MSSIPRQPERGAELESLLARFSGRARSLAERYGLRGSDVDDVMQDVRIRLWRVLEGGGNLGAGAASYVHRTAVSATIDHVRRQRARPEVSVELPEGALLAGSTPGPDRKMEEDELAEIVHQEVAGLPDARGLTVRMHLAGYSRADIADLMGWSEARTRHLLYRGLAELRTRLLRRGIGPESAHG